MGEWVVGKEECPPRVPGEVVGQGVSIPFPPDRKSVNIRFIRIRKVWPHTGRFHSAHVPSRLVHGRSTTGPGKGPERSSPNHSPKPLPRPAQQSAPRVAVRNASARDKLPSRMAKGGEYNTMGHEHPVRLLVTCPANTGWRQQCPPVPHHPSIITRQERRSRTKRRSMLPIHAAGFASPSPSPRDRHETSRGDRSLVASAAQSDERSLSPQPHSAGVPRHRAQPPPFVADQYPIASLGLVPTLRLPDHPVKVR